LEAVEEPSESEMFSRPRSSSFRFLDELLQWLLLLLADADEEPVADEDGGGSGGDCLEKLFSELLPFRRLLAEPDWFCCCRL